ncbi:MAG: hypothetical protein QXZ06_05165, partial [Candidatus Jordarchaeales archaeon]
QSPLERGDYMVVKLSKGKVDENVVRFLLEAVSDLEQRLRKIERQVDVLIQELYGFRLLENGESRVEEKAVAIERRDDKGERHAEEEKGGVRVNIEAEIKEVKKEQVKTVIPTVKLAS